MLTSFISSGKKRFFLFFILAQLIIAGSCKDEKQAEEKTKYIIPDSIAKTLDIETVQKCPLVNVVKLTGMVDFNQDNNVNIYSLVSGNVQNVTVQLGDYVKAGEMLAIVKSTEMAGFNYNMVVAESNLKSASKQLDATKELYKGGLASDLDITNAQTAYDEAVSQLETSRKIMKINSSSNGDYTITAPISGFVVEKNVTNNMLVRPDNGNALFTISDLKDVWVQGNLYEANAEEVHVGDKAEVRILSAPDKVFTGKVDKILNMLDPQSKVIKVRVILKNPDYILKPQMFASLIISNPEGKEALCIPSKALVFDKSRYYVLVYKGKGEANITPVDIITVNGDKVYIQNGLKEGERIISSLTLQLYSELNN